jgi:hypothetical protein
MPAMMKYSPFAVVAFLLVNVCLSAQTSVYSAWPNFPQSPSFFPLATWSLNPTRSLGSGAPFSTDAAGIAGTKMNILVQIDNGGGANYPTTFGVDTNGLFQALVNQGVYVIPYVEYSDNTGVESVASQQAVAASIGATNYLIGYNLGDEPQKYCSTSSNVLSSIPTIVSTVHGYDGTRPFLWNHTDWAFGHGLNSPDCTLAYNIAALQAVDIGSFDEYPLTSPWNGSSNIPFVSGQPQDSMWIQGWSVNQFIADGRAGEPISSWVETGTDELGYSEQNGSTCNATTNLCSPYNNEYRATAEQVNAEVWMTLVNGAMGVGYFCDDNLAYDFCIGSTVGGQGSISAAIAANLTYINTTILSYAPQLNSPVSGRCTMNTGTGYTNYTTSCSNGILTMSTGTSTVPGSAIVKNSNGTLYLFADSDRNGSATMTFTLSGYSGATAKVVYDSNAHYDAAHSSVGQAFTLNGSGQFSDTFGANGHNYQPKIYMITTGGPNPPTGLAAVVQ